MRCRLHGKPSLKQQLAALHANTKIIIGEEYIFLWAHITTSHVRTTTRSLEEKYEQEEN